jgi:hypothetical protein
MGPGLVGALGVVLAGLSASPGTIAAYRKDGHFPDGTSELAVPVVIPLVVVLNTSFTRRLDLHLRLSGPVLTRQAGHGVDDVSLVKPLPCTEQFGK